MSTITGIVMFLGKAVLYGLGLAFGFWLMGKVTGHIDYYSYLWFNETPRFWRELSEGVFGPPSKEAHLPNRNTEPVPVVVPATNAMP